MYPDDWEAVCGLGDVLLVWSQAIQLQAGDLSYRVSLTE